MALFDNGKYGGVLVVHAKLQNDTQGFGNVFRQCKAIVSHIILHRKALCQFYILCAQVGSTTIAHSNQVILGLGTYFSLSMRCPKTSHDALWNEESAQI